MKTYYKISTRTGVYIFTKKELQSGLDREIYGVVGKITSDSKLYKQ